MACNSSHPSRVLPHLPASQGGVGMIEVLITLLVLAAGMFGAAAMHLNTLRESQLVNQRLHASALADDIAGRLQMDRANVSSYLFDSSQSGCSSSCSSIQTAQNTWRSTAAEQLPSGRILLTKNVNGLYQIQVLWDEERNGATTADCDFTSSNASRLACYQLVVQL
ncbi:type IV pilus modification protein PilV [Pokkaliibacter sp. MBI-7]|uniref:type IV pilus modification protein PilV n=1 Tax=Pokkaliibacter sp. MBI-7 TaxID=3040600 RepID=UPI002446B261|nr:type IV pilus modification protein PilV [Pokkaliibacter sp. MBI-7]MDH2435665.1 type IV pilus modification protein PilV [Pokkaliibacter sp. MBI-7]